ncbi:hypothetical protein GGQ86_003323 [Xanthobacter flavus]|uniref:Uncharacterized protein n=2 Tax=Xanthobacteraceae TaxID=335928 RepID=A0A9W6CPX6_XANFL|nr:hypothetical protein [Xanthobacter flavus]MDR6334841.1 hypothetical protein [Xanthobacter flavus]GLI23137.1 hypothetical protein XFLAVUS301_28110 [Xanthobacter flavus]
MRTTRDGRPQAPPSSQSEGVLVHPDQVLDHPFMSDAEKRTLLSSWASDRHAVENAPALRRLDSGAVVPVDDILAALAALPADPPSLDQDAGWTAMERRQRPFFPPWRKARWRVKGGPPPRGGARAALRLVPAFDVNA